MGWQRRLADRYRLVERLGDRDGVEVWRALDETLSRPVRVDVVTAAVAPAKTDRDRLSANIRRAAQVRHPSIATIYDCDVTRDERGSLAVYAVSEFVEGVGLADAGALDIPLPDALGVLRQIAGALAAAHRMGVVHGGLGPAEVVLTAHGVKISGFGIRDLPRSRSERAPAAPGTGTRLTLLRAGAGDDVAALGAMISDRLVERPMPEGVRQRLLLLRQGCCATDPGVRPTARQVLDTLTSLHTATDPAPPLQAAPRLEHPTRVLPAAPAPARPRTDRRLLIGSCALAVAAVAALIFVTNEPRPVPTAGIPQTSSAAPPSSQPAPTLNRVTSAAAIATLNRLRQAVDRSDLAGKIRQDVALDLRNVISNLENDLTSGHPVDLRQRLTDIERKIGTRLREGGLDTKTAANLNQIITSKHS